jgi:hypothetical protein
MKNSQRSRLAFQQNPPATVLPPPGTFINIRGALGNEMICRVGGTAGGQLDDWSCKLT